MFNRWLKRNRTTNPSANGHNGVSQKNSSLIELHQVTKKAHVQDKCNLAEAAPTPPGRAWEPGLLCTSS
jgi:hypothetical protein